MYDKKVATEYRFVESDNKEQFVRMLNYESKDIAARGGKSFCLPPQVVVLSEQARLYTAVVCWTPAEETKPEMTEEETTEEEGVTVVAKPTDVIKPKPAFVCPNCKEPISETWKEHTKCGWKKAVN